MTGMTLVEFLRARLDERETVAQRALTAVRRWPKSQPPPWEVARLLHSQLPRSAGHLEAWEGRETPADVLAEVEAKRRIVNECEDAQRNAAVPTPEQLATQEHWAVIARTYEYVLRQLALPHAEHPEYREEWAP